MCNKFNVKSIVLLIVRLDFHVDDPEDEMDLGNLCVKQQTQVSWLEHKPC